MIEALVEGVGIIVGLALLYYYQVRRPAQEAARAAAETNQESPPTELDRDASRPD